MFSGPVAAIRVNYSHQIDLVHLNHKSRCMLQQHQNVEIKERHMYGHSDIRTFGCPDVLVYLVAFIRTRRLLSCNGNQVITNFQCDKAVKSASASLVSLTDSIVSSLITAQARAGGMASPYHSEAKPADLVFVEEFILPFWGSYTC